MKLPGVLAQVPLALQPPLLTRHSLMSVHVLPSPPYPLLQAQLKLPGLLVHVPLALQPPLLTRHSLTSVHVLPSPL